MSLEEYVKRFARAIRDIRQSKTPRAIGVANDVLAQIKRRIQTTGRNAAGATFAPYSSLYATSRSEAGYQVAFVDFTRTGRMWNSVNPFVERDKKFSTIVVLKARDVENQNKLEGNAYHANRGNILLPSDTELAFAIQNWRDRALDELKRIR